jgi:hypothetical protein
VNFQEKAVELLSEAAVYLNTYGWRQKQYGGRGGPACLLGALGEAERGMGLPYEEQTRVWRLVSRALTQTTTTERYSVWNDAAGRTKDEVLKALEEAARIAGES